MATANTKLDYKSVTMSRCNSVYVVILVIINEAEAVSIF